MSGTNIETWLNNTLKRGRILSDYLYSQVPDDSFGWGHILENMWSTTSGAGPSGTGLLLIGPPGSGKHTAIHHMVRRLAELEYIFAFLSADELEDLEDAEKKISALLDECENGKSGLCLVLEGISELSFSQTLYRYLEEVLCEFYLMQDASQIPGPKDHPSSKLEPMTGEPNQPLFLILVEEQEPLIPSILRGRLQLCRMTYPDSMRRQLFLENHDLGNIQLEQLVEETEGLNYAQLDDLVNALRALTKDNWISYSHEEQQLLIKEQGRNNNIESDDHSLFMRAATQLFEKLPGLLQNWQLSIPEVNNTITDQDSKMESTIQNVQFTMNERDPESTLNSARERLNSLPVRALIEECFGEENAKQLLVQAGQTS